MRIPLFAHDANPRIDAPLCYKSRDQVMTLLRKGEVSLLLNDKGKEWAVQFVTIVEHTLASQLAAFVAQSKNQEIEGSTTEELLELLFRPAANSTAAISYTEMELNAGVAPEGVSAVEILRARIKVAAWPFVGDDKAVRVACRI